MPSSSSSSSSSSSRRRHGRQGSRGGLKARNWAQLPLAALSAVLRKLDHVDILIRAGQVCSSWRRAACDEPELWRRIDMRFHAELVFQLNLHGMAQAAVRRSKGRCEAFWGEYAGDDDFFNYL